MNGDDGNAKSPEEGREELEFLGPFADPEHRPLEVLAARDELEARYLLGTQARLAAIADEGTAGPGNLLGVGVGEELVGGRPTGRLAVKAFVIEKRSRREIGETGLLPSRVDGVPVDVEAVGDARASFRRRRRPAPGGVSIGNCQMDLAGTLACLVSQGARLFVLSNNHVLALANQSPIGTDIPQPGLLDGGACPQDVIARLSQFVPILFDGRPNRVDAAIAQTDPALVRPQILRPFGRLEPLIPPHRRARFGSLVQKSGRTTGYTRGAVTAVYVTMDVCFFPLGSYARFTRMFMVKGLFCRPFSQPGDSGSLVTHFPENHPVGLLFAFCFTNNSSLCNPISDVLDLLGVDIVYGG